MPQGAYLVLQIDEGVADQPASYSAVTVVDTLLCPAGAFKVLVLDFKPYVSWFTGCWLVSFSNLET